MKKLLPCLLIALPGMICAQEGGDSIEFDSLQPAADAAELSNQRGGTEDMERPLLQSLTEGDLDERAAGLARFSGLGEISERISNSLNNFSEGASGLSTGLASGLSPLTGLNAAIHQAVEGQASTIESDSIEISH